MKISVVFLATAISSSVLATPSYATFNGWGGVAWGPHTEQCKRVQAVYDDRTSLIDQKIQVLYGQLSNTTLTPAERHSLARRIAVLTSRKYMLLKAGFQYHPSDVADRECSNPHVHHGSHPSRS